MCKHIFEFISTICTTLLSCLFPLKYFTWNNPNKAVILDSWLDLMIFSFTGGVEGKLSVTTFCSTILDSEVISHPNLCQDTVTRGLTPNFWPNKQFDEVVFHVDSDERLT